MHGHHQGARTATSGSSGPAATGSDASRRREPSPSSPLHVLLVRPTVEPHRGTRRPPLGQGLLPHPQRRQFRPLLRPDLASRRLGPGAPRVPTGCNGRDRDRIWRDHGGARWHDLVRPASTRATGALERHAPLHGDRRVPRPPRASGSSGSRPACGSWPGAVACAATCRWRRDYDGDGLADVAVFRAPTGGWFILRSSDSGVTQVSWGCGLCGGQARATRLRQGMASPTWRCSVLPPESGSSCARRTGGSRASSGAARPAGTYRSPRSTDEQPGRSADLDRERRRRRGSGHGGGAPAMTVARSRSKRAASRPMATRPSMRASHIPAHAWMPVMNARWRLGARPRSRRSGSGNRGGSRLAAPSPGHQGPRGDRHAAQRGLAYHAGWRARPGSETGATPRPRTRSARGRRAAERARPDARSARGSRSRSGSRRLVPGVSRKMHWTSSSTSVSRSPASSAASSPLRISPGSVLGRRRRSAISRRRYALNSLTARLPASSRSVPGAGSSAPRIASDQPRRGPRSPPARRACRR